ncbi:hypothetical protein ABTY61_05855 [Kitasatospora sp. NPDC096128]|uniref:hypothetical protein n=1 Tax=Kitasatospora sp. NPDC096128 TaxID=3155547 RepID=UPI003331A053
MNVAGWVGTVIGVIAGAAIIVNKLGELAHAVLDVRDSLRDRLSRRERDRIGRHDPGARSQPEVELIDHAPDMVKEQ